jgi:hypothetical protein
VMRIDQGDPVLAEELRMLPRPSEPAASVAGASFWCAEQVVKLLKCRRFPDASVLEHGAPPHPAGGGPALQPAPLRRRSDDQHTD